VNKVIHKNLWIGQVIHALTVTLKWVVHALTVTQVRIKGHLTNKNLYLPISNTPVVGASPNGDKSATCRPNGLLLLPTAIFKGKNEMQMSRVKNHIFIALLTLGIWIDAGAVTVMGSRSCGDWVKEHSETKPKDWDGITQDAWLVGFISGIAMIIQKDVLKDQSGESLVLWVTNYCKNNPLNSTSDAGQELFVKLKKKQGL